MTHFNPKDQFNKRHPEEAKELQLFREDKWLVVGFSYALNELVCAGASEAELWGARQLITKFQNLAEPESPPIERYPEKRLTTYDHYLAALQANQKDKVK